MDSETVEGFTQAGRSGFRAVYLSLGEPRAKLFEPWQAANVDLVSAYEQVQRVLREIGFKSPRIA